MYQRVAVATVIRGAGACQTFIDGVVNTEIQRQQKLLHAAMERAHDAEARNWRTNAKKLQAYKASLEHKPNLAERLAGAYVLAWGTVYCLGAMAWNAFLRWGEKAGLWEKVDENAES